MHRTRSPLSRLNQQHICTCPCRLRILTQPPSIPQRRHLRSHSLSPASESYYNDFPFINHNIKLPRFTRRQLPLSFYIADLKTWKWNGSDKLQVVVRDPKHRWKEDIGKFIDEVPGWDREVLRNVERLYEKSVDLMVELARRGEAAKLRRLVRSMLEGEDATKWMFDDGILGNTRPFQGRIPQQIRLELAKMDLVYPVKTERYSEKKEEMFGLYLGWVLLAVGRMLMVEEKEIWGVAKQILAYLHAVDAVPRSLYDPESHPRLSVSEQRVLTSLTDAVWSAREVQKEAERKDRMGTGWGGGRSRWDLIGESLGQFWGSANAETESHGEREILLELVMSYCTEAGLLKSGQLLARDIIQSDTWKFEELQETTLEDAEKAQRLLEGGLPAQMGMTGYELTPPPIDIRKRTLPKVLERNIAEMSIISKNEDASREEISTLKYKFEKGLLSENDVLNIRNLVNTEVAREYLAVSLDLVNLLEAVQPPIQSKEQLRSDLLLRYTLIARLIFNERAVPIVRRHWKNIERVIGENAQFLPEHSEYEHPRWLLGLLLEYYTRYDLDYARKLVFAENPLIKKEYYIDLLPYMAEFISATKEHVLADDIEHAIAERFQVSKAEVIDLDWLQELLSLWLQLGSRLRAIEVLKLIERQDMKLDEKGLTALISGAVGLSLRTDTPLVDLGLFLPNYIPSTDPKGKPTSLPLTEESLHTTSFPQQTWISLLKSAFALKNRPLIRLSAEKLNLSLESLKSADRELSEAIVEILLDLEGIPSAWKFFNAHFTLFSESSRPGTIPAAGGDVILKHAPTRRIARLLLRHSTSRAYLATNDAPLSSWSQHHLAVTKDVQKWATVYLEKTSKWSRFDFEHFHEKLVGSLRKRAGRKMPERKWWGVKGPGEEELGGEEGVGVRFARGEEVEEWIRKEGLEGRKEDEVPAELDGVLDEGEKKKVAAIATEALNAEASPTESKAKVESVESVPPPAPEEAADVSTTIPDALPDLISNKVSETPVPVPKIDILNVADLQEHRNEDTREPGSIIEAPAERLTTEMRVDEKDTGVGEKM